METKESNNYYICLFTTTPLLGVKTKSYATSDQQYLTFAFFLVERQDDVYYSQATTSFVDCNVLPRNLRMDKKWLFLALWLIKAEIMAKSYTF